MKKDDGKPSMSGIIIRSSILAAIVVVPALVVFMVAWTVLDDLLTAAIIGGIVNFVIMGFSLKISKKLLVKRS